MWEAPYEDCLHCFNGHTDTVHSVVWVNANDSLLYSASQDNFVGVWDRRQPNECAIAVDCGRPQTIVRDAASMLNDATEGAFVSVSSDGSMKLVDLRSADKCVQKWRDDSKSSVNDVLLHNNTLFTCDDGGIISRWCVDSKNALFETNSINTAIHGMSVYDSDESNRIKLLFGSFDGTVRQLFVNAF